MNPLLSSLQPYPFERLKRLFAGVTPNPAYRPISLGIGEPRHATPPFIEQALTQSMAGLSVYPATAGEPRLREACAAWLGRRYGITVDASTQVLPVNGSREALFAFTQTVVNPELPGQGVKPVVLCPNPFYQIYEGSALLAGAEPWYVPSDPARNFAVDWASVPEDIWARTQMIFVCSPGNPTGAVMPLDEWRMLFELSDRHGFVIASDECYSEIYFRDAPPPGWAGGGCPTGPHRFSAPHGLHQPVQTQQCAGPAQRFRGRGCCIDQALSALPHLPRGRHESPGAGGQHRRLGR